MEKKNKLGYTWYPKDWGNSEKVFELTLSERGLYRELIDMAMLNDNNTEINENVWSRKFGCSIDELRKIIKTLQYLGLVQVAPTGSNNLFIPSCEPRLNLVRGGSNGGKKSKKNKPLVKPTNKPLLSLDEKNDKPTLNQIEIESKIKEKETNIGVNIFSNDSYFSEELFLEWFNKCRIKINLPSNIKKLSRIEQQYFCELKNVYTIGEFKNAFKGFSKDAYFKENNMLFPTHFLKVENFTKFLNFKEKTLGEKLMG